MTIQHTKDNCVLAGYQESLPLRRSATGDGSDYVPVERYRHVGQQARFEAVAGSVPQLLPQQQVSSTASVAALASSLKTKAIASDESRTNVTDAPRSPDPSP